MWASLLEFLPVSLSAADVPAPIANPTETSETLTREEMIALLAGSKVIYRYQLTGDDLSTYRTGQGVVSVSFISDFSYIMFPIDFQGKLLYSFECIFELPIIVKNCVSIQTGVAPSVYSSIDFSAYKGLCNDINIEYQLDSGSYVVFKRKFFAPTHNFTLYSHKLANGLYSFSNFSGSSLHIANGTADTPSYFTGYITLNGLQQNITSFGFIWNAYDQTQGGADNDTLGIGFLIRNFKLNYAVGGGYDPSGGGETGGGSGGEGGGGTGGGGSSPDYSAQLDKLYDELVKNGQIQQQQNAAIIQGQEDIKKGQQEILDAQKEQTEQDKQLWEDTFDPSEEDQAAVQDDFDANADELKEKLGFFEFLDQFFQGFVDIFDVDVGDGFPTLDIPAIGFDMPDGSHVTIWDDFTVDLADYLAPFKTVLSAIKFFTSLIFIGAFLNYCYDWLHGLLNSWQNDDIIMVDPTTGEVI